MSGREGGRTYPVPRRDIEKEGGGGCGPVVPYMLSEEERQAIIAKYGAPKKPLFKRPPNVEPVTSSEQGKQVVATAHNGEGNDLKDKRNKEGPGNGLTRVTFLEGIAAGETVASIERAYNVKNQTLGYWIKKWDLRGLTSGKARELLGEMRKENDDGKMDNGRPETVKQSKDTAALEGDRQDPDVSVQDTVSGAQGTGKSAIDVGQAEVEQLRAEVEKWKSKATEAVALAGKAVDHKQSEIEWLKEKLDDESAGHDEALKLLNETKIRLNNKEAEFNQLKTEFDELKGRLEELERVAIIHSGITLSVPMIDGGWNPTMQRVKVNEEIDEFSAEIESSSIDIERAASELFDVVQSFAGLIRTQLQQLMPGEDVSPHVARFFQHHNRLHIEKVKGYGKERGWKVSGA